MCTSCYWDNLIWGHLPPSTSAIFHTSCKLARDKWFYTNKHVIKIQCDDWFSIAWRWVTTRSNWLAHSCISFPGSLIQPKTIDLSARLWGGLFPRASYWRLSCWADSCMLCKLDETSDSQEFYYHQLNFDFKNNFGLCPHYGFILTGLGIYRLC